MSAKNDCAVGQMIDVSKIPAFQMLALKVSREIEKENVSVAGLTDLISQDIGLATRLIKLANSVIYSRTEGKTASVKDAINRVGFNEIKNICFMVSARDYFCNTSKNNEFIEQFKHSLSVANICTVLKNYCQSDKTKILKDEILYLAGLMHDIGLVIVYLQQPEIYGQLAEIKVNSHHEFVRSEERLLGCTHADISALALLNWGFPESVAEIVRHHHNHDRANEEYRVYTKILHIADMISIQNGYSDHLGDIIEPFDESAWFDLGLEVTDIPEILKKTNEKIEETELFASISR